MVLFVMVFMYPSYNKTKIKFKFPALVSLITFGIFTVQFTPPLYAMGNIGEARLWNIIHYSYFWLHIINVYYWIGWFRCKLIKYDIFKKESMEKLKHFVYDYSLIFIIIFALFISKPISDNFMNFSCIDTYHSLRTGEAKQYHKEYKERIKLYENKKIKNVKAKPFTAKPKALYFSDIKPDKNHWINKPITEIYGKKSVALETE